MQNHLTKENGKENKICTLRKWKTSVCNLNRLSKENKSTVETRVETSIFRSCSYRINL